jgi:hypothetical protein
MTRPESQLTDTVLMIRPARFESNPLTADSNAFMEPMTESPAEQQAAATAEFEGVADALRQSGVRVIVVDDTPEPHTPDAIFPNNWVSFHADGRVVLYPMEAENRRTERRQDIIDRLDTDEGFHVSEVVDLSSHELEGRYLEGTGSLVLDRPNRVAYACLSSRTQLDVLGDFAQRLDYDVIAFDAVDRDGTPIYHTNVIMSVGEALAMVCADSIAREDQRQAVIDRLGQTGHEVLTLTYDQLDAFAGNMLELRATDGVRVVAMSERAFGSLTEEQRRALDANGRIAQAPIETIERSAGGSVRCMLAEVHLPRDASAAA